MVAAGIIGGEGTTHIVGGGGGGREEDSQTKKDKARERWKILCLVKTSDPRTDHTARQERITEKVDDWMRKMVIKMQQKDDEGENSNTNKPKLSISTATALNGFKNLLNRNRSRNDDFDESTREVRVSPRNEVVPKDEMQRLQKTEESRQLKEQKERMAAREKAEWERERKLILDGKVKLRKEHLKKDDPLLKLHHEKLQMKRKASKGSRSPKPSLNRKSMTSGIPGADSTTSSSISGPKSAIKLRWSSAMNKVSANALMEKKKKALELEQIKQKQEDLQDEQEKEGMMRVNRRKGGISGGPPHPLYQSLKANRLSTYYNAYDELGTFLDNRNDDDDLETVNDVEDATETVVAQLLYDESKDELKENLEGIRDEKEDEDADIVMDNTDESDSKKEAQRMNPVYAALDDAEDVDDMFRIAEIWVNPKSYGLY